MSQALLQLFQSCDYLWLSALHHLRRTCGHFEALPFCSLSTFFSLSDQSFRSCAATTETRARLLSGECGELRLCLAATIICNVYVDVFV
jgi:hypothetical protein